MHVLHLSSSRSSGSVKCFITDGYTLTLACLFKRESFCLMDVSDASLVIVWAAKVNYLQLFPVDQRPSSFGSLLFTCWFTYKIHLHKTDGKRKKKGGISVFLLKRGLRGPAALIILYFFKNRRHISGIIIVLVLSYIMASSFANMVWQVAFSMV